MLLRRPQVEALENATGRVEQDDIRLWLAERLGIERYQEFGTDLFKGFLESNRCLMSCRVGQKIPREKGSRTI